MARRNPNPPRTIEKMTDVIRWPSAAWEEIVRLRRIVLWIESSSATPISEQCEATQDLLIADELDPVEQ